MTRKAMYSLGNICIATRCLDTFVASSVLRYMFTVNMYLKHDRPHLSDVARMSPEEVVMLSAAYIIIHESATRKKRKRWWVRDYLLNRSYVFTDLRGDDGSFNNFTRMSSSDFEYLLRLIAPSIKRQETKFRYPIEPQRKLSVTLRFLATGDSYASLSYTFKISKQIISSIIPEVCQALINVLKEYVKVSSTHQEWKNKAREYEVLWNFPHCIGAIDGKHIVIEAPFNSGSDYYNYKEQFSIVLLGIVDANYNFIYANCGAKGRSSDSGIFQETSFYEAMVENKLNIPQPQPITRNGPNLPYVIVGDSAFALSQNVMKPYPGLHDRGTVKRVFNYRLSRSRRIVENVFGILCAVFRVFRRPMPLKPATCEKVTMACVYLHNFLRRNKRSQALYSPAGTFDQEDSDRNIIPGSWRRDIIGSQNMLDLQPVARNPPLSATEVRNNFAEYFISPEGSVPWQNSHA